MMRLFDTHCHFEATDPAAIGPILRRARAAGVERLLAVGGSVSLNAAAEAAVACAAAEPSAMPAVSLAVGYDRDQVGAERPALAPSAAPSAWGEIGLDYHCSPETREAQRALFADQLAEGVRRNLPVVIHTREADDDTLALLREIPARGIIHCYTGTVAAARRFLDLGLYVSISGIVTFRLADNVREVARFVPDDRLLVETDAPFLAPVPMRGRANEPAFLRHTCAFLADVRGVSAEALAERTFANAERILGS